MAAKHDVPVASEVIASLRRVQLQSAAGGIHKHSFPIIITETGDDTARKNNAEPLKTV